MQVFHSLEEARGRLQGCGVALGNFDGVHLGHQRLLENARARAASRRSPSVALTFHPHPVRILRPQLAPPLLTPLPRKLELLARAGLDAAVVQPFDLGYAASTAEEFVDRDLVGCLGAADVVVGYDFTAGRGRTRVDALRSMLLARGVALHVVQPVTEGGLVVSSTKIREFLLEGNVEAAALLLTRAYDLDGRVEHGAGRGRGFGFATANVRTEALLPAAGVYAVRARVGGRAAASAAADAGGVTAVEPLDGGIPYDGVCNVGVKPTVEADAPKAAEVHLFDFEGRDLYGEAIRVAFVARLRDERRFPSVDALREQIARDVAAARAALRQPSTM